ncbi:MAG: hypothetical protein O3A00_22230 [Planctomycetota bacterium]|nr:hypothetical protein [Planctomycetota bacterium]
MCAAKPSSTTSKWFVTFELNALADVELALIDPVTNTVVRHLAAGVLGPKVPPPLLLFYHGDSQKLPWDSRKLASLGTMEGGIKFDLQGNLYVGYVDQKPKRPLPSLKSSRGNPTSSIER